VSGTIAVDSPPQYVDPAVHNPGLRLGIAFSQHLKSVGITVTKVSSSLVSLCTTGTSKLIGSVSSPPLATIMNNTLKVSDNLEVGMEMRKTTIFINNTVG
jgi:D-alanyl-D-alanine carboxypeptidase